MNFTIKQATETEIPALESILLDTVNWLREIGQPLWGANEVTWESLSKHHQIGDFYIAYADGAPAGCMALVDYDPFFWPDAQKGESLFIHKLAVTKAARKTGVADALINHFKKLGTERKTGTLRLETHALRPRLRAFYERHGFMLVKVKVLGGKFHTAFYKYDLSDEIAAEILEITESPEQRRARIYPTPKPPPSMLT
jgi:GNAT superfamily N-acetyltransferase